MKKNAPPHPGLAQSARARPAGKIAAAALLAALCLPAVAAAQLLSREQSEGLGALQKSAERLQQRVLARAAGSPASARKAEPPPDGYWSGGRYFYRNSSGYYVEWTPPSGASRPSSPTAGSRKAEPPADGYWSGGRYFYRNSSGYYVEWTPPSEASRPSSPTAGSQKAEPPPGGYWSGGRYFYRNSSGYYVEWNP